MLRISKCCTSIYTNPHSFFYHVRQCRTPPKSLKRQQGAYTVTRNRVNKISIYSLCWSQALLAALGIGRYVSLSDVDLGIFPRPRLLPSPLPLPRPPCCGWILAWFCGGLSGGYQLSPLFLCRDGYGSGDRER